MKRLINDFIYSMIVISALMCTVGCQKNEFMPAPEGEQVPHQEEATKKVAELLAGEASASIFRKAWDKSRIKDSLNRMGGNTTYTVFVPNDAAWTKVGITAAKIDAMPTADVDSLMMFYTILGTIRKDQLRPESIPMRSMLVNPELRVPFYDEPNVWGQRYDKYRYKHYLALSSAGNLLVNGKSMGKLNHQLATNGAVFFMESSMEKPTKTALEVMEADGRFTIFLEMQRQMDEIFVETMVREMSYWYGYEVAPEEYWMYYPSIRYAYRQFWEIAPTPDPNYADPNITITTLFAPTDDAFKKVGLTSIDAVMALNAERNDVRFDENMFQPEGHFVMDTIVDAHRNWARMFAPQDPGYGMARGNQTVFFSNDLAAPFIHDYFVNIGGTAQIRYAYKMPFAFSTNNGTLGLHFKESGQPMAHIVESDILTLNGPIHVVDNLLLPKGFKLK